MTLDKTVAGMSDKQIEAAAKEIHSQSWNASHETWDMMPVKYQKELRAEAKAILLSALLAGVRCSICDGEGVTPAICCGSGFGNECCGCPDEHMVPCPNGCDPRQHVMGCAARYIAAIDRVEDAKAAREAAQTARGVANKGDVIADAHRALAAATHERDAALEALRAAVAAAEQEVDRG